MTAPRPARFANRFGSDAENNGGLNNSNHVLNNSVPRKNLFSPNVSVGAGGSTMAPPLLPQSHGKMTVNHQLACHNEENLLNTAANASSYTPMKSQHGHAALAPFTPERGTTPRKKTVTARDSSATATTPSQHLQQQQPCGLSAVISLETSYRTPNRQQSQSTKTKKRHRRNPMSVSSLCPSPTASESVTPMRSLMTPATTTKKHKRSTSSSLFMLATPTRPSSNATTPLRTTGTSISNSNNNTNMTNNTPDRGIKRDLTWTLPNTDTKVITFKPSHRRTPSRYELTPQKHVFETTEDASSSSGSSNSSSDEQSGGGFKMELEDNDDTSIVILPPPATTTAAAAAAPPSATPNKKLRRTIPLPSPNLPGKRSARKKLKKQMTPPRGQYYSSHTVDTTSSPDEMGLLRTGFEGMEMYRMTSTELDPSDFQIELPTKKEVLAHAKICNLMNGYTATQRDFNFAMLSGITRSTLETEYDKSTNDDPMIAGICHRDVVKQVLECADDLVVEGFFREYGKKVEENGGGSGGERIEACVFSSESLRQIIVCFRGSTAAQARPVKSNLFGREGETQKTRDEICYCVHLSFILLFILTSIIFLFITHFATH